MPLPMTDQAWPPPAFAPMTPRWHEWAAWWASDTEALSKAYGVGSNRARPSAIARGLGRGTSALRSFFWGAKATQQGSPSPERKVHVPVAADLCRASADVLFGESPILEFGALDKTEAARVEELAGADFQAVVIDSAEKAAALGGAYLRVSWDDDVVPGRPFLTAVDYDSAYPDFRYGRLWAVTFETVVRRDGERVWRHLERHELDEDGTGMVYHGLYEGGPDRLGEPRPLTDHPETEPLAELVDSDGGISTLSPGLAAIHWPNLTPNRLWRRDPVGRHLGRSDLDGLEPLLDALDEAYTSLLRDVRLGKSMLLVPEYLLDAGPAGAGASFAQSEVYHRMNVAPGAQDGAGLSVERVQFNIRAQEHEQVIALVWGTILRSAGYSPQTFGEGGDVAVTATEVAAKERRTSQTKARKASSAAVALEAAIHKLRAVDAAVFGVQHDLEARVGVSIADGVTPDPRQLAETAQLLSNALAASVETRVRLVNPDADEKWIGKETARIVAENGLDLTVPDPETFGRGGEGLDPAAYGEEEPVVDPDPSS